MQPDVRNRKQIRIIFLLTYGALCIWFTGCNAVPYVKPSTDTVYSLNSIRGFSDATGMLPVERIVACFESDSFGTESSDFIYTGLDGGAYWLEVRLPAAEDTTEPFVLEVGPELIDRTDLYMCNAAGEYVLIDSAGRCVLNSERRIVSRRTVLEISPQCSGRTVFIRMENAVPVSVFLDLYTLSEFRGQMSFLSYIHMFCLGFMFTAGIIFILLSVIKKENLFLYFSLFSFFSVLYQCAAKGFGHSYIWNGAANTVPVSHIGYIFFMSVFAVAQIIFIKVLNYNVSKRFYGRSLLFVYISSAFFIILYVFLSEIKSVYIINIMFLIAYCICCIVRISGKLFLNRSVSAVQGGCFLFLFSVMALRLCSVLLPVAFDFQKMRTVIRAVFYFGYDAGFLYTVVLYLFAAYPKFTERRRKFVYSQVSPFVTHIFQELMTPLTLIQNSIDKMADGSAPLAPLAVLFKNNCRRISDTALLAQALDEQERDGTAAVKKCIPAACMPLFKTVLDSFIPYTEMHKNSFEVSALCDEHVHVCVFPLFLETVYHNILSTALKYSAENTVLSVVLDWNPAEGKLLYCVRITAHSPISADRTDLITSGSTKVQSAYSGRVFNVGMDFVYRICSLYGGSFSVDCTPERTTEKEEPCVITFTAVLYLKECHSGTLTVQSSLIRSSDVIQNTEHLCSIIGVVRPPAGILPVLYKSTILLVEDDLGLLQILSNLFSGYARVLTAVHGQSALTLMQKTVPDIVVSDIVMPFMSGNVLYDRCRSQKQLCHVPFLFLTEVHDSTAEQELRADGAVDFIVKPFNLDELFLKVCAILSLCAGVRKKYAQAVSDLVYETAESGNDALKPGSLYGGNKLNDIPLHEARNILYAKQNLSFREIEIAELLYDNYSNKQIAEHLGIAVSTVATHIQHIYEKCNVRKRNEWIRFMTGF